jgi:hypothetical protein
VVSLNSAGQITRAGPRPYSVVINGAMRDEGTSHPTPRESFLRRAGAVFAVMLRVNSSSLPEQISTAN